MRNIIPNRLWIGSARDARDVRELLDMEIAAIVNLAVEEAAIVYPRDIISLRIPLLDGNGNAREILMIAVESIANLISANIPTFVACSAGMSRSPILVAAALARLREVPLETAFAEVIAEGPHDCCPGLWQDVKSFMNF
jgi:protein-tyrosine phosphatase